MEFTDLRGQSWTEFSRRLEKYENNSISCSSANIPSSWTTGEEVRTIAVIESENMRMWFGDASEARETFQKLSENDKYKIKEYEIKVSLYSYFHTVKERCRSAQNHRSLRERGHRSYSNRKQGT